MKCKIIMEKFLRYFQDQFLHAGDFENATKDSGILEKEIKRSINFAEETAKKGIDQNEIFNEKNFSNFRSSTIFKKEDFDKRVNDSVLPNLRDYEFRNVTKKNVTDALNINCGEDERSGLIKTFMPRKQATSFINLLAKYWKCLDTNDRTTAHMFLSGFEDNFDYAELLKLEQQEKRETTKWSSNVQKYVHEEVSLGRLCEVDQKDIKTDFISSKVLSIEEQKVDNEGVPYMKVRHVYNNLVQNRILKKTGHLDENYDEFYFTTITAEALLLDNKIFQRLMKTSRASSYDKSSFYRQWIMADNSLKLALILFDNGKIYADLNGRMGSASSSIYATLLSNLTDKLFNLASVEASSSTLPPWSVTNQDDSLVLNIEHVTHAIFKDINSKMGLLLNPKKEQINCKIVTWCGLDFDFETKSIQLREKRRTKIYALRDKLINAKRGDISRREVCTFLGCIFSARPIIAAQGRFLSPLCFYIRKNCFLFQPFYKDKEMNAFDYEKFYDEKIQLSVLCVAEIKLAAELATAKVDMRESRTGLARILNLGKDLCWDHYGVNTPLIFVDAADNRWGVGIRVYDGGSKFYSFAQDFDHQQITSWNINYKEMYACVIGVLIFKIWLIQKSMGGRILENCQKTVLLFCDNNCAKSIILGQKVSVRSLELGILLKIFTEIMLFEPRFQIITKRVPTDVNDWADELSRNPKLGRLRRVWPNIYDLLTGMFSTRAQEYKILLGYGAENKKQSIRKTELTY